MSLVVLVTILPAQAAELARAIVHERLAACVNMLPTQSAYRWNGEVVEEPETMLLIKTSGEKYPELEQFIRSRHSYEIPEIVALQVNRALPEFATWLAQSLEPA